MFLRTASLTLWPTSLPSPRPWLNHMPIHEAVPGLCDGTNVEESKTQRWELKMTLEFKPKWLWYIGRGDGLKGNMIIVIVLIWDAKEISRWRLSGCKNMGLVFRMKNWRWRYTWDVICREKINKAMRLLKERRGIHSAILEDKVEAGKTRSEK